MKLETIKTQTTEVFVSGNGINVTCNPWANHEGVNVMVHGDHSLALRAAMSLRWEEMDTLIVALTAARSV